MNFAIKKNMDMQEQMYQDVKAWLTGIANLFETKN
jgi:hypothetical protein